MCWRRGEPWTRNWRRSAQRSDDLARGAWQISAGLLLRFDRAGQRPEDRIGDVVVDHVVAYAGKGLQDLCVVGLGRQAAITAGRDVNAQLLFGELARANLEGVGTGLHTQAALN